MNQGAANAAASAGDQNAPSIQPEGKHRRFRRHRRFFSPLVRTASACLQNQRHEKKQHKLSAICRKNYTCAKLNYIEEW
jgi:hypothetical protein